jgi:hypothetical protein
MLTGFLLDEIKLPRQQWKPFDDGSQCGKPEKIIGKKFQPG